LDQSLTKTKVKNWHFFFFILTFLPIDISSSSSLLPTWSKFSELSEYPTDYTSPSSESCPRSSLLTSFPFFMISCIFTFFESPLVFLAFTFLYFSSLSLDASSITSFTGVLMRIEFATSFSSFVCCFSIVDQRGWGNWLSLIIGENAIAIWSTHFSSKSYNFLFRK